VDRGPGGELFNTGLDTLRSARFCYFDLRDLVFSAEFGRFIKIDKNRMVQFLPLGLEIPDDHPDRNRYFSMNLGRKRMNSSDVKRTASTTRPCLSSNAGEAASSWGSKVGPSAKSPRLRNCRSGGGVLSSTKHK
jgi:hypothetical protein